MVPQLHCYSQCIGESHAENAKSGSPMPWHQKLRESELQKASNLPGRPTKRSGGLCHIRMVTKSPGTSAMYPDTFPERSPETSLRLKCIDTADQARGESAGTAGGLRTCSVPLASRTVARLTDRGHSIVSPAEHTQPQPMHLPSPERQQQCGCKGQPRLHLSLRTGIHSQRNLRTKSAPVLKTLPVVLTGKCQRTSCFQ